MESQSEIEWLLQWGQGKRNNQEWRVTLVANTQKILKLYKNKNSNVVGFRFQQFEPQTSHPIWGLIVAWITSAQFMSVGNSCCICLPSFLSIDHITWIHMAGISTMKGVLHVVCYLPERGPSCAILVYWTRTLQIKKHTCWLNGSLHQTYAKITTNHFEIEVGSMIQLL